MGKGGLWLEQIRLDRSFPFLVGASAMKTILIFCYHLKRRNDLLDHRLTKSKTWTAQKNSLQAGLQPRKIKKILDVRWPQATHIVQPGDLCSFLQAQGSLPRRSHQNAQWSRKRKPCFPHTQMHNNQKLNSVRTKTYTERKILINNVCLGSPAAAKIMKSAVLWQSGVLWYVTIAWCVPDFFSTVSHHLNSLS